MRNEDIIRAWKDQGFYNGLSDEARTQLPAHPGMHELSDEELEAASGGDVVISAVITASIVASIVSKIYTEYFCDDR